MPYYIFAWIASALYGLEVIFGKLTSKYLIPNAWLFNFLWNLYVLLGVGVLTWIYGFSFPSAWGNIILGGFFYALGATFYTLALYRLDVSILAPLYSFRTVFAVILGSVVLGEVLSLSQYGLIGIVIVAGIFVSLDENWTIKSFFNKSVGIAMLDMVALAFMALFTNKALHEVGFWPATFWITFIAQIFLLPTIFLFKKDIIQVRRKQAISIFLVALTGIGSALAVNKAYETNIGITAVIISVPISMFFALAFSIFKPELLERHTAKVYAVRFIAATIMVIAAIKLSV